MTDEQLARLNDVEIQLKFIAKQTSELHDALLSEPLTGGPNLITRVVNVVVFAENSSWAGKWMVRIVLTIGALLAALKATITGVWQ